MISGILQSLKYGIYLSVSLFVLQKVNVSSFKDDQNLKTDLSQSMINKKTNPSQSMINNQSMTTIYNSDDIIKSLENMVQQLSGVPGKTTLVAVNENEVEKYSANANPAILIPEPDIRPTQLIFEKETVDPTILISDQDLPTRTLLVSEPTEPESTVVFIEPEYKKPSVLYMEPENQLSPEDREKMRRKAVTRLVEESEDVNTKASLCSEPLEYPVETTDSAAQKNKASASKDSDDESEENGSESEPKAKAKETKSDSGMSEINKLFAEISGP